MLGGHPLMVLGGSTEMLGVWIFSKGHQCSNILPPIPGGNNIQLLKKFVEEYLKVLIESLPLINTEPRPLINMDHPTNRVMVEPRPLINTEPRPLINMARVLPEPRLLMDRVLVEPRPLINMELHPLINRVLSEPRPLLSRVLVEPRPPLAPISRTLVWRLDLYHSLQRTTSPSPSPLCPSPPSHSPHQSASRPPLIRQVSRARVSP